MKGILKNFLNFSENSEFWVSILGVLVQISEGIFKFSLKNHPNLPFLSANIMRGNLKFMKTDYTKHSMKFQISERSFCPSLKKQGVDAYDLIPAERQNKTTALPVASVLASTEFVHTNSTC